MRHLNLAIIGIALLALAAPGWAAQQKEKQAQDLGTLPKEVRQALDRATRLYERPLFQADWTKVFAMQGTDHPIYQVQGTNRRGNKIEVEVTAAGRIIDVEEHGIPFVELPIAVSDALKAEMPQFRPAMVEAIYQADPMEPACYGFEGRDSTGAKVEVYISADGTFLNR